MAEVAHADESDNRADERQPLDPLGDIRVSLEAKVSCEADEPHGSTPHKPYTQPTQDGLTFELASS